MLYDDTHFSGTTADPLPRREPGRHRQGLQLVRFSSEIAADHAAALRFGYGEMTALGVFWVLARLRLRIFRRVHVGDTVRLETWPGAFRRLFAARHFRFVAADGGEIAAASSQWMILSLSDQRPRRVEIVGDRMPDTGDLPAYFDFTSRLPSVPAEGEARVFPVRYSMEDVNGHLNNAQYMALAQDAVEDEFGAPVVFEELEATFHSAVCAPDELHLHSAPAADGRDRLVSGYKTDGTLSFCAALRGVSKNTDGTNK